MKKQTLGIVAGAAGAALLLGGGTFALWSDSGDVDGGTISSGNLDVEVLNEGTASWVDSSSDRTDVGHSIDLSTFAIVPGDTITGTYGIDLGLEGDNMLANLKLTSGEAATGALAPGLTIAYAVEQGGTVIATGDSAGVDITLRSSDNGNADSTSAATVPAAVDATADLSLVVTVTFEDQDDQDLTKAAATLAGASVSLDQVRTGAGFN